MFHALVLGVSPAVDVASVPSSIRTRRLRDGTVGGLWVAGPVRFPCGARDGMRWCGGASSENGIVLYKVATLGKERKDGTPPPPAPHRLLHGVYDVLTNEAFPGGIFDGLWERRVVLRNKECWGHGREQLFQKI